MASYNIRWKHSAEKDLRSIDPQHIPPIIEAVESLGDNPFPPHHRKLRGAERIYRIRIKDYRVIYQVDDKAKVVIVYHIRHRSQAYRQP
ncbi:type II toxin-antitoxin system mRNA interferase toxin, RelE/StbE family [candidate division TA06 bacterium B3_TA06]|uniref:Type II toxin-antitoxin system mRNA interferase toxin, RelE/StbE family n=1 Tax=candidate division TA06 bacterium B3_TA06 TaxID=2012487 RepID=A0A532V2D1_UNCT6|nr:MAG: type II toxin-antitoxin system mRNA interferase toxin, RelE/StbE family [candidate division TA06 bacterium B3_TA06]